MGRLAGDMKEGEKALEELRGLGQPIADVIGPHPYAGWQQAFDPLLTPGARNYWKSNDFLQLTDEVIDSALAAVTALPDPQSEIFIAHLAGAMTRVDPAATPFPQRARHFVMNVHTRWSDAAKDKSCIAWARDLFDRTAPHVRWWCLCELHAIRRQCPDVGSLRLQHRHAAPDQGKI